MMRTITALFDSRAEAERAVDALVAQVGVDRDRVTVHAQEASGTTATTATRHEDKGFWASLGDLFMPDEDRYAYSEGIRRGGILVTAQVEDSHTDRAMDVLEEHGAVDLDQREQSWRAEGWPGYQAGEAAGYATYGQDAVLGAGGNAASGATAARSTTTGAAATGGEVRAGGEEVIPLAEEKLRVGKREVDRGRVRVRSYVVETPVEEQVTLREERVDVERRAADRPATGGDELFRDRVVEVSETGEEAVVDKQARVREEVVVRKEADQRTETVRDTVRRTEVEVDDERSRRGAPTAKPGATRGRDRV